jgi:YVTN family beta-propeller protein
VTSGSRTGTTRPGTRSGATGGILVVTALAIVVMLLASAGAARASPTSPAALEKSKVKTCNPEQARPEMPGYDPKTKEVYVPNYASSSISVISGKCTIVSEIMLHEDAGPMAAAYDPANGYVYVTDYYFSQVYEISGTTIVTTITNPSFELPWGIAYDPDNKTMVVANSDNYYVSVFNEATGFFKNVPVGAGPRAVAYDAEYGNLVVANFNSDNVTILNATHLTHVTDLLTGSEPIGVAFDSADNEDYVTNEGSNTVSVIRGETVETTITGFDEPFGLTYSSANHDVYVCNLGANSVSILSGSSVVKTVKGLKGALGAVYDPANKYVYVGDSATYGLYLLKA